MLIGEYTHTIDEKKRISLPIKFRKIVGKTIIITHGLDNCLFLYPLKEWEKISQKLGEMGFGQADTRGFNRFMLAGASEVEVDSVGRILIPEHLKQFAGILEKVVFAGVYNRVEIWNDQKWIDYKTKVAKEAEGMAEKLGQIGAL
jgi:MraZ protein